METYNSIEFTRQLVKDGKISQEIAETIFPQLKESEDERIRKELIGFIQEEIESINRLVSGDYDDRDADDIAHQNWCKKALAWLEKQGSQNLANSKKTCKVEPKFKVGDWVVYNDDICQIVKREEGCNKLVTNFGIEKEIVNERNLSTARLWTIQDAKDGDILYSPRGIGVEAISIVRGWEKIDGIRTLCAELVFRVKDNEFIKGGIGAIWWEGVIDPFFPATKEQRDLLFQKMKEAGYEWDAEKKELKKIEQKQDVSLQINPSEYINDMGGNGCYLKNTAQTSAWSEGDENEFKWICVKLQEHHMSLEYTERVRKAMSWLKSLKERYTWKPSESDILLLERIANGKSNPQDFQASLCGLIGQLKKLKG